MWKHFSFPVDFFWMIDNYYSSQEELMLSSLHAACVVPINLSQEKDLI